MQAKPRYQVACYDDDGNEVYLLKRRLYLGAIDAFNHCVRQVYIGAAKYTKVYMFDMAYPDTGLFVVGRFDADFH